MGCGYDCQTHRYVAHISIPVRIIPCWIDGVLMIDYGYDIECLPNFFSLIATRVEDNASWRFVITPWLNQGKELNLFLTQLKETDGRMVGYNNLGYDYPMVHLIMSHQGMVNNEMLYSKSQVEEMTLLAQ